MDSFKDIIGKNVDDISLNESSDFIFVKLGYSTKLCGRRYPTSKLKLCDLDYFDFPEFSQLFKRETLFIIWHDDEGIISDLEIYHLSNDFDILFKDYYYIKKAVDNGEVHNLREGDTQYLGASRLADKVLQPNSDKLANRREFVLKKKYLQKIINEISYNFR